MTPAQHKELNKVDEQLHVIRALQQDITRMYDFLADRRRRLAQGLPAPDVSLDELEAQLNKARKLCAEWGSK